MKTEFRKFASGGAERGGGVGWLAEEVPFSRIGLSFLLRSQLSQLRSKFLLARL